MSVSPHTCGDAPTRRGFLQGAGAAVLGAGLVACTTPPKAAPTANPVATDLRLAALAARLELALVDAYTTIVAAAEPGGRLAPAPAAFLALARTAAAQHADHAALWNATLAANHVSEEKNGEAALVAQARQQLGTAESVADVAAAALRLEQTSVQTYVAMAIRFADHHARRRAMQIGPVEAQHAAVLGFLLGAEPVPDAMVGSGAALHLPAVRG